MSCVLGPLKYARVISEDAYRKWSGKKWGPNYPGRTLGNNQWEVVQKPDLTWEQRVKEGWMIRRSWEGCSAPVGFDNWLLQYQRNEKRYSSVFSHCISKLIILRQKVLKREVLLKSTVDSVLVILGEWYPELKINQVTGTREVQRTTNAVMSTKCWSMCLSCWWDIRT